MAVNWIRSKPFVKFLIISVVILVLSFIYIIYMNQWMNAEFTELIRADAGQPKAYTANDGWAGFPVEELSTRFISVSLLFMLGLVVITALVFSFNPLSEPKNEADIIGEEDMMDETGLMDDMDDEDLIDEDLIGEELIDDSMPPQLDIIKSRVLANSYNKMVDVLQKMNEMEKQHSIELAKANTQLSREIAERKRAEAEIRHLSSRLISSNEEARKELAQDLHDEFGQKLTALHLDAEALRNSIPEDLEDQRNRIQMFIELIEQLGDKIRSISSDLRPDLLDDLGLVPTMDWYINEFSVTREDIKIDFQAVGFRKRLNAEVELVLYRIFQEGLTNVVKHAKAVNVTVRLIYSHPKVIFILQDDGVGFNPDEKTDGIGILGMRERAVSTGGTITIKSQIKKGTTIRVELPVELKEEPNGRNQSANSG